MKLRHIALAALAVFAGQSYALDAATTNAAGTLKVYMAGSSALKGAIGNLFTQNCQPNTLTTYTLASAPNDHTIYSCTLSATNDFGLGAINVAFQKRDVGGSGFGVYPVANGTPITFINLASCTGPTTGTGSCSSTANVVPDGGFSDVEPSMFSADANTPVDFSGQSIADGTMTIKPANQTIFGLAVSQALYAKLQADQGIASNVRPSVSQAVVGQMLRAGFPYDTQAWKLMLPNTTDGTQNRQVTICRRAPGSGSQAAANRFFLEYPFNAAGTMGPYTAADSSTTSNGTTPGNLLVVEGASTGDVPTCLNASNSAGGFAMGHLSLESAETSTWKFVKINGQEPSRDQAKVGKYAYVVESTCQFRNSTTGSKLTFLNGLCNGAGAPVNLNQLATNNQAGVMTPPQNAACPGTAAPATTFCSAVTRNGNTAEFLSFF